MGEGEGLSSFLSDREKPLADVTRRVPVGARQNGAGAAAETLVVVVGRVGRITSAEADALRDQLERIDAPSFGLVANFAPGMGGRYGYGYYK
jgi:hypothetical protein